MSGHLVDSPKASSVNTEGEIRKRIQLAISRQRPSQPPSERRRIQRRPYPYPVYLTPINEHGEPDLEETIVVLGKHISELGLDFYHREALPYRRMIASLDCSDGHWVAMLMDLSWCRFGRHGWYENGGRFVRLADSPLGTANDSTALIA